MESKELEFESRIYPNGFRFLPSGESFINFFVSEAAIAVFEFSTSRGSVPHCSKVNCNYYPYVLKALISQRSFGLYIEAWRSSARRKSESKIKAMTYGCLISFGEYMEEVVPCGPTSRR